MTMRLIEFMSALPFSFVATRGDRRLAELGQPFDDAGGVSAGVWCESGSARAVMGVAIRASVDQLAGELPRARLGEDPEGVHQARVATRRLRSDLRTFGPLLDDAWRIRTRSELKRLSGALGAVRDADVLEMRLLVAIDSIEIGAGDAASVLTVVRAEGSSAHQALIAVLDDERVGTLLSDLRRAAADPPTTLSALGRAEIRLRPLVRRPWRRLVRAVDELADEPAVADLHEVRLLAKRTRYAADAVSVVYGRDARRFGKAITGIQEVLGDMNDAEVATAWLRRTAGDLDPCAAFAAGELAHHFRLVADDRCHGWEVYFERALKRSSWLD
jgi:CHAD domain-containing protein